MLLSLLLLLLLLLLCSFVAACALLIFFLDGTTSQRSVTHEVEMDENEIVVHQRRCSTAVGVTPSHPSAIVDLFHEMESIGKTLPCCGNMSIISITGDRNK